MTYDNLLIEAECEGAVVKEKNIPGYGGRTYGNRIAIHKDITTSIEKTCVLAEELGHYHTTVGKIRNQSITENRKQELHARLHGYNRLIGLNGIIRAYRHRCRNLAEMAEYLEVTEEYFYRNARKVGLIHVMWDDNVIVTKQDVDQLLHTLGCTPEDYTDEIVREPFVEAP